MEKFKYGTFFKGKGKARTSLVIGEDTKDAEVTEFLKGLDEGTANRIKSGCSSESIALKAQLKKKEAQRKEAVKAAKEVK